MAKKSFDSVLQYLRRVALTGHGDDAHLLERFARRGDEAAFERLVLLHGPMVLGLCRRLLRHEQDAEDAFQATFLTLARKAGSIRNEESVPSWLYKVAFRVACRTRGRDVTNRMSALANAGTRGVGDVSELRGVLDEAIAGLPEAYRRPIVLCYLESKTVEEAAHLLGCPRGTVATRLVRAREQLRRRLTRRGWRLSAGALATALTDKALAAPLPMGLAASTMAYISGKSANAGALAAKVVALSDGVLRMMLLNKLKMAAGIVLAMVLAGMGVGLVVRETWAEGQAQQGHPADEQKGLVQDTIGRKEAGPKSVEALKKAEPTLNDLSTALGMHWWQFIMPKNIAAIEIGITDGGNRFTLIKRWELRKFLVPGPLKVSYQEEGHDEYKLVLITKGASTQIAKNKKPSEVSVSWDQGQWRGTCFELLKFASSEALVIKME
jgi:RNA polymerase sigma factor (sigma-70 family)